MSEAGSDDAASDAGTQSVDGGGGGLLGTWPRRIGAAVVTLVTVVAVLYLTGVIGAPAAGLEDHGDWGEVTDERTEIVTTVWVNNPNPVGVALGDSVTVDYDLVLNDVLLADGSKSDVTIPPGNSTTQLRTDLINDRLADWWVGYVRANETVDLDVKATVTVDALASVERDLAFERRMLTDSEPVIDALSASVNSTSDTYAESVETGQLDDSLTDDLALTGESDESLTVGYEIERGWATWDSVTGNETTVLFHLQVHNPGDVPVPASPDGIGVAVDTNDVRLLEAESDEFTLRSVDSGTLIQPNRTREVTFAVTMDNEQVDDWFTSHVRADQGPGEEATAVSSQFQLVFEEPATGTTFRVPGDSPATYDCTFGTTMLVDDQETETTCGESTEATP